MLKFKRASDSAQRALLLQRSHLHDQLPFGSRLEHDLSRGSHLNMSFAEESTGSARQRADATASASTSYEHLLERHQGGHRVWGAIVSFGHLTAAPLESTGDGGTVRLRPASEYFVDVLVNTAGDGVPAVGNIMGCAFSGNAHVLVDMIVRTGEAGVPAVGTSVRYMLIL